MNQVIEAKYPITFRAEDAQTLGQHLSQHNSVSLIGMKRVGIGNFLQFFLNHPQVAQTYIHNGLNLFIVVDLNNLVERTLYAFWMLTLKKIVDAIENGNFSDAIKEQSRDMFTQSIQLSDFFFTLESVHKLMTLLADQNHYVTLFFLRFDRLKDVITNEFFANIQGLKDAGNHISYVFTSFRPLHEMVPQVFLRSSLSGFSQEMYLKPAAKKDMEVILSTFLKKYDLKIKPEGAEHLIALSGGHVQYLHLLLIKMKNERFEKADSALIAQDEEIRFLSEELFSSLTPVEQEILMKLGKRPLSAEETAAAKYLLDTGILHGSSSPEVFSPLFQEYLQQMKKTKRDKAHDFTKKEHQLFYLLEQHVDELVERDTIIEMIWPDEVEFGVSDWSIDRLVSRVRTKLKTQNSEYRIVTVITRGYKLVKKA